MGVGQGRVHIARFGHARAFVGQCIDKRPVNCPIACKSVAILKPGAHRIKRTIGRPPVGCNCGHPSLMLHNIEHTKNPVGSGLVNRLQDRIA